MPVGFMCFKGLNLHEPEILSLLRDYPETPVIIDHFGFFHQVMGPL
jgi:predicted TIM-barrel fold metal-dependent hydrolase